MGMKFSYFHFGSFYPNLNYADELLVYFFLIIWKIKSFFRNIHSQQLKTFIWKAVKTATGSVIPGAVKKLDEKILEENMNVIEKLKLILGFRKVTCSKLFFSILRWPPQNGKDFCLYIRFKLDKWSWFSLSIFQNFSVTKGGNKLNFFETFTTLIYRFYCI